MANELISPQQMQGITKLDETSRSIAVSIRTAESEGNEMTKGLIMARGMKMLREMLTPAVMADVMELQGLHIGFRTDRDKNGGYKSDEIRDVLIQALIRGLYPTGNEFNIIAGNLYVTKEGFSRLLSELPGLTELQTNVGVPQKTSDDGALVPCRASWRMHGKSQELVCEKLEYADYRIPVRVNAAMNIDAVIGKAESKLLRRVYKQVTGSEVGVDDEPITVESKELTQPA